MHSLHLIFLFFSTACSDYQLAQLEHGDVFIQQVPEEVDILLVVDDSRSMRTFQEKIGSEFDGFIKWLITAGVDYRIGVTTTSMTPPPDPVGDCEGSSTNPGGDLVSGDHIDSSTVDPSTVFASLVNVGTCGSATEMGFESAWALLSDPQGMFSRPKAHLSLIFLSDEDDFSPDSVSGYVSKFQALKSDSSRESVQISAMVIEDLQNCSEQTLHGDASPGLRYKASSESTGGFILDLCSADFSAEMEDMSMSSARLQDVFMLGRTPDPTSIQLSVDEKNQPCDGSGDYSWDYVLHDSFPAIKFSRETLPQPNSRISIQYNHGGGDPSLFCIEMDD